MSQPEVYIPSLLTLTSSAIEQAGVLLQSEGEGDLFLRVFVTGGGCSGFQYGFSFDDEQAEDDTLMEFGAVKVAVDALSGQYLMGAQVDYLEDLAGSRFVVNNPNAETTCGCGASFSV